jgi:kumamolisin
VYGASAPPGGYATGAGLSAIYPRPAYQNPVAATVGGHRGVADVAMDGCAWVYLHIPRLAHGLAWYHTCGTSFAAPLFAGITADATQIAGHPLGPLNPALYQMHGTPMGVLDVTHGTDSLPGIPGYPATPGYDLPTGIGTPGHAYQFATTLAHLATTHPPGPQR